MKQLIIAALACLAGTGAQAQVTETRIAQAAQKLEVTNGIEVIITQNDTAALKIEAADWDTAQKVVTKYKGNTLKVYLDNTNGQTATGAIKVYVSQSSFPQIKAGEGALVTVKGKWHTPEATIALATGATFCGDLQVAGVCKIDAASGSGFRGIVNVATLKATVSGGAYAKIMGTAGFATILCSSGTVQAGKLMCERAEVKAQKASAVSIQAKKAIKADTDTSSSITYYGSPEEAETGEGIYAIKRYTNRMSLN